MTGLLGYRRVLVVTAVEAERAAVQTGLGSTDRAAIPGRTEPAERAAPAGLGPAPAAGAEPAARAGLGSAPAAGVSVEVVGVGSARAAAATARLLARAEHYGRPFDAVLCAGIAGGFAGRVDVGGLAIATESIAADLGADSPDGFLGLDELGFGTARLTADPTLVQRLGSALPGAVLGPILTVSTVTGTADGTRAIRRRHPDAVAEAMEGFGVASAASLWSPPAANPPLALIHDPVNFRAFRRLKVFRIMHAARPQRVVFGEVRAISNLVGPRDRAAWRVAPALEALQAAFRRLAGVTLER